MKEQNKHLDKLEKAVISTRLKAELVGPTKLQGTQDGAHTQAYYELMKTRHSPGYRGGFEKNSSKDKANKQLISSIKI